MATTTSLEELPDLCLHNIMRCLDADSRSALFRTSKGGQDKPGCATAVLAVSNLRCQLSADIATKTAKGCRLLHWAAQLAKDMELSINCAGHVLADVLSSCFEEGPQVQPHHQDYPCFPGVTRLVMRRLRSHTFLPSVLVSMFPNLLRLEFLGWQAEDLEHQQYGPAQEANGASGVQHISVTLEYASRTNSAVCTHVAEQLCSLPSLASLLVDDVVLQAAPASVLKQLTRLEVWHQDVPLPRLQAALSQCTQLHTLAISAVFRHHLVASLPSLAQLLPQLRCLDLGLDLDDHLMPHLLALRNLTSISLEGLNCDLRQDYTSCPCQWRSLHFKYGCSDRISQLPLQTLDTPVTARIFRLMPSKDHAANIAFIQAATPHLLRCGGIHTGRAASIDTSDCPAMTQPQAETLLQCWAPYVPRPDKVYLLGTRTRVLLQTCVARLWPDAEL